MHNLCRPRQFGINIVLLLLLMHLIPHLPAQQIHNRSLYSQALQQTWRYSIYIPKAVQDNPHKSYPVVFLLHGMFNSNKSFASRGFERILNTLINDQMIEPVIVVFPNGFRQSWWVNSDAFGQIQDAFFDDLIPHINSSYPVSQDINQRVIAGISMGGFGAINYAFHSSLQFKHLVLFSPALFLPTPLDPATHPLAAPTNWQHNNVLHHAIHQRAFAVAGQTQPFNALLFIPRTYTYMHQRNPKRLHELNILLYYGDRDPITDSGTRFFHDFLVQEKIPFYVQVTSHATHSWSLWQTDFALALTKIFPFMQ